MSVGRPSRRARRGPSLASDMGDEKLTGKIRDDPWWMPFKVCSDWHVQKVRELCVNCTYYKSHCCEFAKTHVPALVVYSMKWTFDTLDCFLHFMVFIWHEGKIRWHKFNSDQSSLHNIQLALSRQAPISQSRKRQPFWSGRHVRTGVGCGPQASPLTGPKIHSPSKSKSHSPSFQPGCGTAGRFPFDVCERDATKQRFLFRKFLFYSHALVTQLNVAQWISRYRIKVIPRFDLFALTVKAPPQLVIRIGP